MDGPGESVEEVETLPDVNLKGNGDEEDEAGEDGEEEAAETDAAVEAEAADVD